MKVVDYKHSYKLYNMFLIRETDILLLLYFFNILCMYAMSVNEITKLAVSVLAFQ